MKKLLHFMKMAWPVSPSYILLLVGNSVCNTAKVIFQILLPMYLINELTGEKDPERLLLYTGLIVLNQVGMTFLGNTLLRFTSVKEEKTKEGMMKLMSEKIMNLEYSCLENPHYLDLKERAVFAVQNQNTIANLINMAADVATNALALAGSLYGIHEPSGRNCAVRENSFQVQKGEKISIVGLNGAGKSTLIKLLCRMYQPDAGEILVNGRNICDYEYFSYMSCISAVFLDYRLFNFTIAENICCQAQEDPERVRYLIEEVGLKEKTEELPHGIRSRFGRDYEEEGIEMSGGQCQKIAIARALYKEASMVILDEPASTLDPIAEAEIYENLTAW